MEAALILKVINKKNMSTKSSIVYTNDCHIYSDCSQPRTWFGNYLGDDIFIVIDKRSIKNLSIDKTWAIIKLHTGCNLVQEICTDEIKIFGGNIEDFEIDEEDLCITVRGGSQTSDKIMQRIFN